MAFDFSTLVTDRFSADVARVRNLISKLVSGTATEAEVAEFNSAAMRGAYNYTDLNRVNTAMDEINQMFVNAGYYTLYKPFSIKRTVTHLVPVLPEEYTQLEYIESTGTQCIDTGIRDELDVEVSADFLVVSSPASAFIWSGGSANAYGNSLYASSGLGLTLYYNTGGTLKTTLVGSGTYVLGQKYSVSARYSASGISHVLDGVSGELAVAVTTPDAATIKLFSRFSGTDYFARARIYKFSMTKDDTLVRNFIPARRNSDSVVGLYDLANSVFYTNAGTGEFIAGNENIQYVEVTEPVVAYSWIESDIPTAAQLQAMLTNVEALRSVVNVLATTPQTPENMDLLTLVKANNIEKILHNVSIVIQRLLSSFRHANALGFYSGNMAFPTQGVYNGRTWQDVDALNLTWDDWDNTTFFALQYHGL